MAYTVIPHVVPAYIVMALIVMAYILMAYLVVACIVMGLYRSHPSASAVCSSNHSIEYGSRWAVIGHNYIGHNYSGHNI